MAVGHCKMETPNAMLGFRKGVIIMAKKAEKNINEKITETIVSVIFLNKSEEKFDQKLFHFHTASLRLQCVSHN